MNIILTLLLSLIVGMLFGFFYFGGLWSTVKILPQTRNAAVLFFLSFFLRSVVTLGGFYFVLDLGGWIAMLAAICGFIAMRIIMVQRIKPHYSEIRLSATE